MVVRIGTALITGVAMTFLLLFVMQFLITTGKDALTEKSGFTIADFIRVRQVQTVELKDRKPPKPPEVEQPPPDRPPPQLDNLDPNAPRIALNRVSVNINMDIGGNDFSVDGEYLPIVRIEPMYPRRAQSRGIEGYCDMEFTVTRLGTVIDAVATVCSSSVFKNASTKAVLKWKYKPRVVNGEPIDSTGVQTRLTYRFDE